MKKYIRFCLHVCPLLLQVLPPVQAAEPGAAAPATALSRIQVQAVAPVENLGLDEPAATGSRLRLTVRETPATVTVVDRETIELRGATDTQEVLKSVPGVIAASPPGSAGSVSYRGFGASSLTQLFNGISVQYDAIAARPVDSWIYERIEVVGGPSSYLYGAGAVGGAINYVTRVADRDGDALQARASVAAYGTTQLSLDINQGLGGGGAAPRHFVRADINRSGSDGYVDDNQREAWTIATSWLADLADRWSHTLALEYQHEHVDRPYWGTPLLNPTSGIGRINPGTRFTNYNSADGIYEQTVKWARSLLDFHWSDDTSLRNTVYHYDALRDYRNVEVYRYNTANTAVLRSSPLLQRHDQTLTGDRVEWQHHGRLGGLASDWAAGADHSVNRQTRFPRSLTLTVSTVDPFNFTTENFFAIPGMVPGFVPDRDHRVGTSAMFLENRTQLGSGVSLVAGLRHERIELEVVNRRTVTATDPDYFRRVYTPTTGRLGLMYAASPAASFYAQYSTAADPPAGILATATFSQVRDFDLATGRQLEVGAKLDLPDGRGAATMAAYRVVRRNIAVTDPNNPSATIPVGQQSARGVELALDWRLRPALRLAGNLSWTDAQFDDFVENVNGVATSRQGNRPANMPVWVGNLWVDYDFSDRWRAGADARHVGSRYGNTANTISDDAYWLLGAYVEYRINSNLTVSARARNLTDQVYAASLTGTPMFYLGAPRTVELQLQARF